MSHSEDDDDFLSADEDVEIDERKCDTKTTGQDKKLTTTTSATKSNESDESSYTKVIQETIPAIITKKTDSVVEADLQPERGTHDEGEDISAVRDQSDEEQTEVKSRTGRRAKEETATTVSGSDSDDRQEDDDDEDDDDEEAALAERIRERNLKIARNFSVEIAKNLKASAPIPVLASPAAARREREYSEHTLTGTDLNGTVNPPAPPPTPALSSSFSNLSEQASQQTNSSGTSPSLSTQYSWRLPPKTAANLSVSPQVSSSVTGPPPSKTATAPANVPVKDASASQATPASPSAPRSSEQARSALDRLSERLGQPEKNLFERVADDIRNMSIKGDDTLTATDVTSQLNALPSTITDLGSTLGGWGWSGATKLLSSATQVTSQVGSVLNSIVDVSQEQLAPTPSGDISNRQERDDARSISKNSRAKFD